MKFITVLKLVRPLAIAVAITAVAESAQAQRRQQYQQQDPQQQDQSGQQQDQQNQQQDQQGQGGYNGRRGRGGGQFGNNNGGFGRQRYQQQYAASTNDPADYSIISDQSIFMRQRYHEVVAPVERVQLTAEQANVLTGIVLDESDNQYRAYFEDLNRGAGTKVKVGDMLANGKVTEIRMDSVGYQKAGSTETTWIQINSNLTGSRAGSVATNRLQNLVNQFGSSNATPAVAAPLDPNTASLSMEERLRLRRMAESQGVALPTAPAPAPAPVVDTTPALPAVPVDPATANLSVEERMRLRRQQETGAVPR